MQFTMIVPQRVRPYEIVEVAVRASGRLHHRRRAVKVNIPPTVRVPHDRKDQTYE